MTENNSLDAMIVRNIHDIEAAYQRVNDQIETALTKGVAEIFAHATEQSGWDGDSADVDFEKMWLAPKDWKSQSGDETSEEYDLYFCLSYSGEAELTWLSTFVGAADLQLGLFLETDMLTGPAWRRLIKSAEMKDALMQITSKGFTVESANGEIVIYFKIDREKLACGFENDDLSEALEPIAAAMKMAIDARSVFEPLLKRIRADVAAAV